MSRNYYGKTLKSESLVNHLFARLPPSSINLALAGTGINVCSQVPILTDIGIERINGVNEINIASGSSYSYLVFLAYKKKLLVEDNFLSIDKFNRRSHQCNFLYGFYQLARYSIIKKSFLIMN